VTCNLVYTHGNLDVDLVEISGTVFLRVTSNGIERIYRKSWSLGPMTAEQYVQRYINGEMHYPERFNRDASTILAARRFLDQPNEVRNEKQ